MRSTGCAKTIVAESSGASRIAIEWQRGEETTRFPPGWGHIASEVPSHSVPPFCTVTDDVGWPSSFHIDLMVKREKGECLIGV
jgi:hypothetical protein